jgi:GDPmannose 4,6-dehydratase
MTKSALIIGVSGQDGAYLAELLLKKGYEVTGTSRDSDLNDFRNLQYLNIKESVNLLSVLPTSKHSICDVIRKIKPNEIYNLSGQSSVALSFEQPEETTKSIILPTLNILEAIKDIDQEIKFYNACSSECFGDTCGIAADEKSLFQPCSPYAIAKAIAFWQVSQYRNTYELFVCSGILFNHDSPLRPRRFVTRKIISTAYRIANGENIRLSLGELKIKRDWGWAPDYVKAMHKMLQIKKPEDFVIATGELTSLEKYVEYAFKQYGLDWHEYVDIDEQLFRPTDIKSGYGNANKAKEILGWVAKHKVMEVIELMTKYEENST